MPDLMNPSADLQAGIAAGWSEGQRQIEELIEQIEGLEHELDEAKAHAQRLEAALVLTEDQRDAAGAELARLHRAHKMQSEAYRDGASDFWNVVAQRDAAIAERDALRKQLDDLKRDYTDTSYWARQ